jgi:dihydrofolate reductase
MIAILLKLGYDVQNIEPFMNLSIITAFDQNQLIGQNNSLPWNIPEDLAYFKRTTINQPIVMGRKTFESIGRPLPKRSNIVISSQLSHDGLIILPNPDQVFDLDLEHAFIIGGAKLYQYFLPHCQKLYITHIEKAFSGDTYFPKINWENWNIISETPFKSEDTHCRFSVYERQSSL